MPLTQSSRLVLVVVTVLAAGWMVFSALLIARDPWLGVAVGIAPGVVALLIRYSLVRLLSIIGGGLFVLGSSSDVSISKLIYAALVVVCAAISAYRLLREPPAFSEFFRPLIWAGLLMIAAIILGFVGSPLGGDVTTFGRQSLFYVLIALGPVIGLDSGRDLSPNFVYSLIGVIGSFAAIGFALDWLDRRGVTSLDFGRVILSSLVLPALAFGLALALVFHAAGLLQRVFWLLPVLTIPIAMLVTGTRTNLIIFAAIPAVAGRLRDSRVPIGRMILLVTGAGVIGAMIFSVVAATLISDPGFLDSRVRASIAVLSGDGASDQSFALRSAQYDSAWQYISGSPLFGLGLGYFIPITLDTPLLTVVRFGWIGTSTIVVYLGVFSWAVLRTRKQYGTSVAHTAWWAFMLVILLNIPFGTPLEDRGFGFALLLASMAIASAINTPQLMLGSGRDGYVVQRRVKRFAI